MSNAAKRTERVFITTLPTHPAYPCSSLNRPAAVGFNDLVYLLHQPNRLLERDDDLASARLIAYAWHC